MSGGSPKLCECGCGRPTLEVIARLCFVLGLTLVGWAVLFVGIQVIRWYIA